MAASNRGTDSGDFSAPELALDASSPRRSSSSSSGSTGSSSWGEATMDTLTPKEIEEYFHEFQSVLEAVAPPLADEDDSSDDAAESEAEWLREAGFDHILDWTKSLDDLSIFSEESSDYQTDGMTGPPTFVAEYDALISTYTYSQQKTVRKRITDYQTTIRKKKAGKSRPPDVRDVFASNDDVSEAEARSRSHSYEEAGISTVDKATSVFQAQSSVDDPRLILKASPEERSFMSEAGERSRRKAERKLFLRSGNKHKQGYKVSSEHLAGMDSGGVEVLSFSYRSSMKRQQQQPLQIHQPNGPLFIGRIDPEPTPSEPEEEEEEGYANIGFEVLDGTSNTADIFPLPEARVVSGPLGVTSASDLGQEDGTRMRGLALIELTAFFDANSLSYSRRKAAKKKLKDGVFGSSLLSLVEEDSRRHPGCKVPVFLQRLLHQLEYRGLQEEGLLRIAGSRQKVEALKALVDNNWRNSPRTVEDALSTASVHDVVSLLKNFIRELPEPLLSCKYMDAFIRAADLSSTVDQLRALNLLVLLLSDIHRETLKRLTLFMVKVASTSARNRMSAQNVAVIMAPNLFPPKGSLKKDTVLTHEVAGAARSASVTRMLIHYHHCLWIVPPTLLRQVRDQNELNQLRSNKGKQRLQGKGREEGRRRRASSLQERSIVVAVTGGKSRSIAVTVDSSTSARDVLDAAKGSSRNDRFSVSLERLDLLDQAYLDQELYEIGGNIVEHKLDPVTRISAILRENPDARFQIRPIVP